MAKNQEPFGFFHEVPWGKPTIFDAGLEPHGKNEKYFDCLSKLRRGKNCFIVFFWKIMGFKQKRLKLKPMESFTKLSH
jgi:hypothetical protein